MSFGYRQGDFTKLFEPISSLAQEGMDAHANTAKFILSFYEGRGVGLCAN